LGDTRAFLPRRFAQDSIDLYFFGNTTDGNAVILGREKRLKEKHTQSEEDCSPKGESMDTGHRMIIHSQTLSAIWITD
jgi:hypothetical protein